MTIQYFTITDRKAYFMLKRMKSRDIKSAMKIKIPEGVENSIGISDCIVEKIVSCCSDLKINDFIEDISLEKISCEIELPLRLVKMILKQKGEIK